MLKAMECVKRQMRQMLRSVTEITDVSRTGCVQRCCEGYSRWRPVTQQRYPTWRGRERMSFAGRAFSKGLGFDDFFTKKPKQTGENLHCLGSVGC